MDLKPYIHVRLRLIDKHGEEPLSGENYRVQLYDNDMLEDDFLGEGIPDASGCVDIRFHSGQFSQWGLGEELPDLYFKVLHKGEEIFRSPTAFNANPLIQGDFDVEEGLFINMGSWVVDVESQKEE